MPTSGKPSRSLLLAEPGRAAAEYAWLRAAAPLLVRAPRGDGHHVLVLPGLGADDGSTRVLRRYLRGLGHHVHGWRLGRNLGPTAAVVDGMTDRLAQLAESDGRGVSIVGWSLGGIYARVLAHRTPAHVRTVITLGSPFRQTTSGRSHASWLYERHAGRHVEAGEPGSTTVTVPATAIYTRTDGVVDWRACLDAGGPRSESIEVRGSHCGLGFNPTVAWIVADRLAQPAGRWQPYRTGSATARLLGLPRRQAAA